MTKNLVLAGALLAVLASPAFAEEPYSANDRYDGDAKHLNTETQGAGSWDQIGSVPLDRSIAGAFNTNDGPNGTVIRDGIVVGQDPDPSVRAQLGAEVDQRGNQ
jgi:hypothetical protein